MGAAEIMLGGEGELHWGTPNHVLQLCKDCVTCVKDVRPTTWNVGRGVGHGTKRWMDKPKPIKTW